MVSPGGGVLHLRCQRDLAESVRDEGDPRQRRQQLERHYLAQRDLDLAISVLCVSTSAVVH